MAYYRGVLISVIVSLLAIPVIKSALTHHVLSQFLPMYIFNYSLALTAAVFFIAALPPNICCPSISRRNEIYYMCCLFMCICTANATMQAWRLNFFKKPKFKVGYFRFDEPYLMTPFGMTTEVWNDYINYIFYVAIIYMIDNNLSYRNLALYWAGATLTSEMVSTIGSFTGSTSNKLQYSEIMHIVQICATSWVIFKLIVLKPRYIGARLCSTKFKALDKVLIIMLGILNVYAFFRGLAALNGRQKYVFAYVSRFEPYILHPSRFGAIWVLYTAVYGIPFQIAAMRALRKPGSEWLINLSILYAGSICQGTFTYLSFNFFPSADKKFKAPYVQLTFVIIMNVLLLIVAHAIMYRTIKEQGYFLRPCLRTVKPPTPSPASSEHTCTYIVNN